MDVMKKGLSTLEKCLIFLFVAMTGACIALMAIYFTEKASTHEVPGPDSGCGGPQDLSGGSGTFTSGTYGNEKSCTWHITVDPDKVIHLWFEEFALEDTKLCTADFITLLDSLGTIGKYCGHTKPKPLVSLTNRLTVYFDTNDINTDKGFKAHYRAVAPELAPEIAGAGGFLQGDQGLLTTPGFPQENYLDTALYQWRITVPQGSGVRLTFTSFDLVPEVCGDFVQVYDGSSSLGKYCGGTKPKPVESSSNTMIVRFKTDSTMTSKGFSANYTKFKLASTTPRPNTTTLPPTTSSGGPVILHGRKGVIQSLGFPNPYPAHYKTSWKISVLKGFLVKLQITEMALTGQTGDCKDKLMISDDYSQLGTFCGYFLPPVVVSATDTMSVTFQSDGRFADRGFSANWEAVYPEDIAEIQACGGFSRSETGLIKSQNWPLPYKANSECMWNIVVPSKKKITLRFTHFDLEARSIPTFKCADNIIVYDINDATNGLIRKHGPFCGTRLPRTIQTRGNRLMIRFHSNFFIEGRGFRAFWTTNPSLPTPTVPPPQPNPWDNITIDWPSTCGRPAIPPVVSRIVNGERAKPHSWPWQVSMQVWPSSQPTPTFLHICGGTLIHKNWVLTAAHCFMNYADELHRWRMCLGKHNLTYTEPSQRCINVSGVYLHEDFKYPTVPSVEFDIALIRLDGEVLPSDEISPACLPSEEEVLPADKKCYATGWGDEKGNPSTAKAAEALNQVALPVVPFDRCKRMDWWWFQVKPSMICCGYTLPDELKSTCQGDSGGPLVCQDTPGSPWEVHGITSFGPIGCIMNKKPSVFTRSSAYLPWINNIIRRDIYNERSSGCGGPKDLNGTSGIVSSTVYPVSYYSNKADCHWNIRVPDGKLVHIQFHNFSLEESWNCMNDKVRLSDSMGSLGTYCSHIPPQERVSYGNTLHISFFSNNRVVDTGFTATWKAVDPSEDRACGGSFSTAQGELITPNWPSDYHQSACIWHINIPSAKSVHVSFTHFELQAVNFVGKCVDYVEIFNGESMASQGQFCGFAPPPNITVPSNKVVIRFVSNGANKQKGFRGYWTTDANVIPTLPPPPPNPWDNITINWPENCGSPAVTPNTTFTRVVNGEEAIPHSWPWQVSMQISVPNLLPFMHNCGGSLIHPEWILTAAHCFMLGMDKVALWRMCLGKHHMNTSMDVPSAEECIKVDGIIGHEGFVYDQDPSDITNDIALVHLAKPVSMKREISPICMPKPGHVMPARTPCFVTGWGDEKGSMFPQVSKKLNQAALPIIDFETCSKPAYWWDVLRPSMICAGYESPDELKSACQGDSGGPFACTAGGANPTWEVHGIVSFGPRGCIKDKKPSVFTRVSAFSDWIDNNIKRFMYEKGKTN